MDIQGLLEEGWHVENRLKMPEIDGSYDGFTR